LSLGAIPVLVCALASAGCGEEDETEPPPKPAKDAAAPPACPAGEAKLDEGECEPAGIPASACGQGFTYDGRGGCTPVLPDGVCPDGQMAIPGEAACREVAPCGSDPWGDIPVDADTQYVDGSYPGTDSDGSAERPWTTISAAISAASSGALVAIAAGTYSEDVAVVGKGVRLWGRCPKLVGVRGQTVGNPAVDLRAGGAELRGVAVTGPGLGVAVTNAKDVVVDQVWIHDTGDIGAYFSIALGPAAARLSGSLVEAAGGFGVYVDGAELTMESSVSRESHATAMGPGTGLSCLDSLQKGSPCKLTVSGSLIEQVMGVGLMVGASEATIDGSVIRDVEVDENKAGGFGLEVIHNPNNDPGTATMRASVVERTRGMGISTYGSSLTLDATAVLDTLPGGDMRFGRGIYAVENRDTGHRSQLKVTRSLVDHAHETGIFVLGSDGTITSTWVRDTQVQVTDQQGGAAIAAALGSDTGQRAQVTIDGSVLEGSPSVGLYVSDADLELVSSVIRGTKPQPNGLFGDGVGVLRRAEETTNVKVRSSRIESSARSGIANFAGNVEVLETTMECNPIDLDGERVLPPFPTRDFAFDDRGGNACGCSGEVKECVVLTANLVAPKPLEPGPP